MKVHLMERGTLDFPSVPHDDVSLLDGPEATRAAIAMATRALEVEAERDETVAWLMVAAMGSALLGVAYVPPRHALVALVSWMRETRGGQPLFWFMLCTLRGDMPAWAAWLIEAVPTAVAPTFGCAIMAPEPQRTEILRMLASHPEAAVRQHFFELMGQHRMLMPPGAIETKHYTPEALAEILGRGATDPVAKIRERAIAAAFGMNVVAGIRDAVIAATADPEMDVRQYALLALGTLADRETLDLLRSKLVSGADPEVGSAISALARRPDGLADALALAADTRPWVRDEVISSIAYVAAPLSEAQISTLTSKSQHPGLAAALEAQRRRLAPGGRELGADGHWFVVRRKDETA